jgi:iron complex outermembrane recepter protein
VHYEKSTPLGAMPTTGADTNNPNFEPEGVPDSKRSRRRALQDGIIRSAELAVTWDMTDHVSLMLAGKNLTDRNYVLVDGFPEEGRNFTATLRVRN